MRRINCEINLVRRCQVSCKNCNRLVGLYPDPNHEEDMSVAQVQRFLFQVRDSEVKIKRLKLLGGEPLLHPEFDQIYYMLLTAVEMDWILKVKIESNGIIPRPNLPGHDAIHWAGKPFRKKVHLPTLWSPQDLGLITTAPCSMPRICGISLDAYGYSLCSMCVMMNRIYKSEHLYVDEFPWNWREVFAETVGRICPHCIFSAPQEFKDNNKWPISDTPEEGTRPTATWKFYLAQFDGHAKKERW